MKEKSNNNDSDKIMGLSGAETFTSGFVVVAAIYFVFSEYGVVYFHPFVLFTHLFRKEFEEKRGEEMMKNLQNYAKNVQLVKRNIILCVLLAFI